MTSHQFAVRASITRPDSIPVECGQSRIVRIAWLVARFVRRDLVRFESYRERFGTSLRTYHRDIAALRDAGIYIDTQDGGYRMICFRPERAAA